MEIADLERIVEGARLSAFRLETRAQYLVPQEAEEFAAWRSGRPTLPTKLPTSGSSSWTETHIRTCSHCTRTSGSLTVLRRCGRMS